MPFAIEVAKLDAPTELYDLLGEDTPLDYDRHTEVFVTVSVYRNVINWFILGDMNKDAQSFRDEVYECAGYAHRNVERGCGGYYRGSNSVHVKRQHADAFEAMYNHNHYPLGGPKGEDVDPTEFPDPVTPEEFREHMQGFLEHDIEMHDGTPRFLTQEKVDLIVAEFTKNYDFEIETNAPLDPNNRTYTDEDIQELNDRAWQELPCKLTDEELQQKPKIRGIDASLADTRQPDSLLDPSKAVHYGYVAESRAHGRVREAMADEARMNLAIEKEMQKELSREFAQQQEVVRESQSTISPMSSSAISALSFTHQGVATSMSIALTDSIGVLNTLKEETTLEKRERIKKQIEAKAELKKPKIKNQQALRLVDVMINLLSTKHDVQSIKDLKKLKVFRSAFEESMTDMRLSRTYTLVDTAELQAKVGYKPGKSVQLDKVMKVVNELTESEPKKTSKKTL